MLCFRYAWCISYSEWSKTRRCFIVTAVHLSFSIRVCIQKFPDWVDKETYAYYNINTRWEATQRVMAAKLTRRTQKIAIQLHLVAESCIICSFRSRRAVRKLLVTLSYSISEGQESQEGVELNVRQLLVYVDEVNLSHRRIKTIQKVTYTLLDTSKEANKNTCAKNLCVHTLSQEYKTKFLFFKVGS
jgi:hypothetical protein